MASSFQIGKRAENQSIAYLEAMGYYVVKSEASKGVFDLVAIYIGDNPEEFYATRLVQVKRGSSPLEDDMHKLQFMRDRITDTNTIVELHHWHKGARKPLPLTIERTI